MDGEMYFRFATATRSGYKEWPFNRHSHLIMKAAEGVADDIWPERTKVDWVCVFKLKRAVNE